METKSLKIYFWLMR